MNEKHRSEFYNGGDDSRVLGEDEFLQQVMVQTENIIPMKISIDTLLTSVAQVFSLDESELSGPSRKRSYTEARGVAAWLVQEVEQYPLADLARRMNRDPSVLSLHAKKIRDRMTIDDEFKLKIIQIKSDIISNNSITQ